MSRFTDEEMMAFADGEVDGPRAGEIAAAAAVDSAVAMRIKAFKDSRRVLCEAFASRANERVPQKLLDVLADPKAQSNVVPFKRRVRPAAWLPLAAVASVGALALGIALRQGPEPAGSSSIDGPVAIADQNLLTTALETHESGVPLAKDETEVMPLSTVRTDNAWCREFESRIAGGKTRGMACRNAAGEWQIRALEPTTAAPAHGAGGYETASGERTDLASAVGAKKQLTPDEERAQIAQHWK